MTVLTQLVGIAADVAGEAIEHKGVGSLRLQLQSLGFYVEGIDAALEEDPVVAYTGLIVGTAMGIAAVVALAWISQTGGCIGAENLRKVLCSNNFAQPRGRPDADRVYADAVRI